MRCNLDLRVCFMKNINTIDVQEVGSAIRHSIKYKQEGINVNFVQIGNPPRIRTYERGVEGETLSCGTGAVAAALALHKIGEAEEHLIEITTNGGNLSVSFEPFNDIYRNIWLTGAVEIVYVGEFVC